MNDTKIIIIVDVYYFLNKIYEHKSIYQKKKKRSSEFGDC